MSDLKGVPKRAVLTEELRAYPSEFANYIDLAIFEGRVVKDRHGVCREATSAEIAACKELTPLEAKVLIGAAAWRGQRPAEGTRRRIILDAIGKGDVLSDTEALEIADTVELALIAGGDGDDVVTERICDEIDAAVDVLDQLDIPQEREGKHLDLGARVAVLGDQVVQQRRDAAECYRLTGADPSDGSDAMLAREAIDEVRRFRAEYDELETANAAVGDALDRIDAPQGATYAERIDRLYRELCERVSQAGYLPKRDRDDAWVSEVAYQAAGAGTRPLLEDHPDYVFPAERVRAAVAELLTDFGIPRACADCAEEQLEHGRKEMADRDLSSIADLEDRVQRVTSQREDARMGEDRFKAQRDAALHLLRWLIGDLIPPDLIALTDDEETR